MNNYHDQSENEPVECPECFSSMTEYAEGCLHCAKCDNKECKGDSNE